MHLLSFYHRTIYLSACAATTDFRADYHTTHGVDVEPHRREVGRIYRTVLAYSSPRAREYGMIFAG